MPSYLFGSHVYSPEHEGWQRILQKCYTDKQIKPVCLCVPQGTRPSLYIALARGQYLLKRLPYSGPLHAPHCEHYEPPPELSGLGQVNGSAIREEPETQMTMLALDFALTKGRSRHANAASEVEYESVRNDGTKLTMRGLLHYLMDEAGLTRWSPAMDGKRDWFIVRRELLKAAASKLTKGEPLLSVLFVPEKFAVHAADEIKHRQREAFSRLAASPSTRMILIAEIKGMDSARYGWVMTVKHMPDVKLMMTEELHKHVVNRFAHHLQLWAQLDNSHLTVLATVSMTSQGVLNIEAACLINVNEQWLPFESLFEWELLEALYRQQRRFSKGLRYNLPSTKPLASAVLLDTGESSTALFVVPQEAETAYDEAIDDLSRQTSLNAWRWQSGTEKMPAFPPKIQRAKEQPTTQEWLADYDKHQQQEPKRMPAGQRVSAARPATTPEPSQDEAR